MLSENDAANVLGMTSKDLRNWSFSGQGPLWLKNQRGEIVYPLEEIEKFIFNAHIPAKKYKND